MVTHCKQTALSLQGKSGPLPQLGSPAHTGTNDLVRLLAQTGARISSEIIPAEQEYRVGVTTTKIMCSLIRDSFQQVFAVAGAQRRRKKRSSATSENLPL